MHDNFINRQTDLERLNSLYDEEKAQLVIIYGKRRVGKTEIIKQFIRNKSSVYYLFDKRPEKEQLADLGQRLGEHFNDPILQRAGFKDWEEFFEYVGNQTQNERLILALDEFPYLVENNRAAPSLFQKGWDEHLRNSQVFLILCGSSIAMMENEILGRKAPLYGRRTAQFLVHPMGFYDAWKFYPSLSFRDFLSFYTVLGGIPAYLLEFEARLDLKENVLKNVFHKEVVLFREVPFLLREEFREPRNYLSILHAIAYNRTKFGEIKNETGLDKSTLYKYLGVLEDLRIISREVPVTVKHPHRFRRSYYQIQENFIKFWFEFINPFRSELELGEIKQALAKFNQQRLQLEAQTYEQITVDILRQTGRAAPFNRFGRWWDGESEVDLVGINAEEDEIIFGEAKWSRQPVDLDVYHKLRQVAQRVEWGGQQTKRSYALFSKSGFTSELLEEANSQENLLLFEKDQLC